MRRTTALLAVLAAALLAAAAASASRYEGEPGYICTDNGTSIYVADQAAALERFHDAIAGECPEIIPPIVEPVLPVEGQTFLCMSHFGGVPVAFDWSAVADALQAGWFVPSATVGNSPLWDNVGAYHLICNTDGLKATGTGLNGSGGAASDVQDAAAWKVTLAEYGNPSPNHYALFTR